MNHSDEKLLEIFNREFRWKFPIEISEDLPFKSNNFKFKMYYFDYLMNIPSPEISSSWKLHNKLVQKGYVYLNKYELIRVIAQTMINELKHHSKDYSEYFDIPEVDDFEPVSINERAFPPCVKILITKADKGIFLTHSERLIIANFLNIIKYPINEIVNIFKNQSDFNRRTSFYFINYSRKNKNKPHNCSKILSLGKICKKDKFCERWSLKNPLGYYLKRKSDKSLSEFERIFVPPKKKYQFKVIKQKNGSGS
jgi:DNA primase large subunit